MPPKFFITHSWHDIDFAKRLCNDLRANGLDGFLDERSIRPGESIPSRIERGLTDCDVYIPIFSPDALASTWCEWEIDMAITMNRKRNGRPHIIPVIAQSCNVPDRLIHLLYVDFCTRAYADALNDLLTKGFGILIATAPPQNPAQVAAPQAAPPTPAPPRPAPPTPASTPARSVPRDELVHLYNEARALQSEGDLPAAAARFKQIVDRVPDYRDAKTRWQKLQLYLQADDLMKQGLADKDDLTEPWLEARTRLEELLKLDPQFLDARAKLATARQWIALSETYEQLLDALDVDDWAKALPLFGQIRSVKPNYKRTQTLFERAWGSMVRAGLTTKKSNDGKEMVLVPAGEFLMGSNEADDEKPPHQVYLDAFYISRYPVTNAEYKKFVDEMKHRVPQHWASGQIPNGKENHPVVNVTWDDATAYCKWAGGRLPTEAEWEKAASWDEVRKTKRRYPWGDDFDAGKCNSAESKIGDTTPVGKYSPAGDSAYGVSDMAGNVSEWCADWYDGNYYASSPEKNPQGPSSGQYRVLRGGSWFSNQDYARGAFRSSPTPDGWSLNVGFRFVVASSFSAF